MLAERVIDLGQSSALRKKLSDAALKRSHDFSWRDHLERIVGLVRSLKRGDREHAHAA
jgi:glycosyltransferase involved in cell wall biosynthesis